MSRLIYKKGDHERASMYVHQALDDVQFYNSRLRKIEIGDILPIIERDRYEAVASQRNWFIATSILFVLLSAVILYSYWFIRKKNHKLTEAKETIATQLDQLQLANRQLKEDDKIKNAYIGRSFYTNSEFIAKLEKLYLMIDRKIVARQYDDLRSMMKLSTLNAERENMYEAFDQTFLKIFPDFVQKYNLLFEEKDRKLPPNEHSLTSEMRIFALIRLGINDSERIAKFLNYSVHMVNTYKTRIKNRSTVENEQFDCRKSYSKSDWIMWAAAMAPDTDTFLAFAERVYHYADKTPTRWPLSDWFWTDDQGAAVAFRARSVVGGHWMKVLMDKRCGNK